MNEDVLLEQYYKKVVRQLRPKLNKYMGIWSHEFKLDKDEVESLTYKALDSAIKTFKESKQCALFSHVITLARHTIIDYVRANKNGGYFISGITSNPCEFCVEECEKKCVKFKMYHRGQMYYNEVAQPKADIVEDMAAKDYNEKLFSGFAQKFPKHRVLMGFLIQEIEAGNTGRTATAAALRKFREQKSISRWLAYRDYLHPLQEDLKAFHTQLLNTGKVGGRVYGYSW